jgi:hypothetical protein
MCPARSPARGAGTGSARLPFDGPESSRSVPTACAVRVREQGRRHAPRRLRPRYGARHQPGAARAARQPPAIRATAARGPRRRSPAPRSRVRVRTVHRPRPPALAKAYATVVRVERRAEQFVARAHRSCGWPLGTSSTRPRPPRSPPSSTPARCALWSRTSSSACSNSWTSRSRRSRLGSTIQAPRSPDHLRGPAEPRAGADLASPCACSPLSAAGRAPGRAVARTLRDLCVSLRLLRTLGEVASTTREPSARARVDVRPRNLVGSWPPTRSMVPRVPAHAHRAHGAPGDFSMAAATASMRHLMPATGHLGGHEKSPDLPCRTVLGGRLLRAWARARHRAALSEASISMSFGATRFHPAAWHSWGFGWACSSSSNIVTSTGSPRRRVWAPPRRWSCRPASARSVRSWSRSSSARWAWGCPSAVELLKV